MRVRDDLAALSRLHARPEVDPTHIVLTGCGLGSVVAWHVAALDASLPSMAA